MINNIIDRRIFNLSFRVFVQNQSIYRYQIEIQFSMQRVDSKTYNNQNTAKYLAFQPKVHSRQHNKSKSNKKNQVNRNIITPCQPLGDKLLKAALDKNQRKSAQNRREKTQQSILDTSLIGQNTRCYNHPDKKGEYFIQSQPNKKFCLKCSLTLNNGNHMPFTTNEKQQKKQTLDMFKQQLSQIKHQIEASSSQLHTSIEQSQQKFSEHSTYINESFSLVKEQLEQKRRQLINGLIVAQQSLKKVYEENLRRMKKMTRSIEKYQFDISKFYQEIIQELPKDQFDHIMLEYENKINRNFKAKLHSLLCQEGVCVYIPNLQMKAVIEKASVEFYQPVSERDEPKESNASFYGQRASQGQIKSGSNSLDSKLHNFPSPHDHYSPVRGFALPQRRKQPDLSLFERKPCNLVSPRKEEAQRHRLIENKENINLQNFAYDYYHPKPDPLSKFTFKR